MKERFLQVGVKKLSIDGRLPHYAVEDWETWEDGWELIDGFPFVMEVCPTEFQTKVVENLRSQLVQAIDGYPYTVLLPAQYETVGLTAIQPALVLVGPNGIDLPDALIVVECAWPAAQKEGKQVVPMVLAQLQIPYHLVVLPFHKSLVMQKWQRGEYAKVFEGCDGKFTFDLNGVHIQIKIGGLWE